MTLLYGSFLIPIVCLAGAQFGFVTKGLATTTTGDEVADTVLAFVDTSSLVGDAVAMFTYDIDADLIGVSCENVSVDARWYQDPLANPVTSHFNLSIPSNSSSNSSTVNISITLGSDQWKRQFEVSTNVTAVLLLETLLVNVCSVTTNTSCLRPGNRPLSLQALPVQFNFILPNHRPVFVQKAYSCWIAEGQAVGTAVRGLHNVHASDPDPGTTISYSLMGRFSNLFRVTTIPIGSNHRAVQLLSNTTFKYEDQAVYSLVLVASDSEVPRLTGTSAIEISIVEVNDSPPVFNQTVFNGSVLENATLGTVVATVATSGANSRVYFSIERVATGSFGRSVPFACDPISGEIFISAHLDAEATAQYAISVLARDRTTPSMLGRATVNIQVVDANEYPPVITVSPALINVMENAGPGLHLANVYVHDADLLANLSGLSVTVTTLDSSVDSSVINLRMNSSDPHNGLSFELVTTSTKLDREKFRGGGLTLVLTAHDGEHIAEYPIHINIININDEPPALADRTVSISELVVNGSTLAVLQASDPDDVTGSQQLLFSITAGNDLLWVNLVQLDNRQVAVVTIRPFDREYMDRLLLKISVTDGMSTTNSMLTVNIQDANDNSPEFANSSMSVSIPDDTAIGSLVYMLEADDHDIGTNGRVQFSVLSRSADYFSVNRFNGEVTLHNVLNSTGTPSQVWLLVQASDLGQPFPRQNTAWLNITIQKVSTRPPIVLPAVYHCYLDELANVHQRCTQVYATVSSGNGTLAYGLQSTNDGDTIDASRFTVNSTTGEVTTDRTLDISKQRYYTLVISVVDSVTGLSSTAQVFITILAVNKASPSFQGPDTVHVSRYAAPGTLVTTVTATDSDLGLYGVVTYRSAPSSFQSIITVDGVTGEMRLSYTTSIPSSLNSVSGIVHAMDQGSPAKSSQRSYTVNFVNSNRPPVLSQPLYVGTLRLPLQGSNGMRVLTVNATDPDAGPSGTLSYSLSTNAYFSVDTGGTVLVVTSPPTVAASYTLTLSVTDGGSPQLQHNTSIRILTYPSLGLTCMDHVEVVTEGTNVTVLSLMQSATRQYSVSAAVGGNLNSLFYVSSAPAVVMRHADRNQGSLYYLLLNETTAVSWAVCSLTVRVVESRDDYAVSLPAAYNQTLPAYAPLGSVVVQLVALDADGDAATYSISGGTGARYFTINKYSGVVTLRSSLGSVQSSIVVQVLAVSARNPGQNATSTIYVHVLHFSVSNFTLPVPPMLSIPSNLQPGSVFYRVMTSTLPVNTPVNYSIESDSSRGLFSINSLTGNITVTQLLPVNTPNPFNLTIQASIALSNVQVTTATVIIAVNPSNRYSPVFQLNAYYVSIPSNTTLGSTVYNLSASDADMPISPNTYGKVEYIQVAPASSVSPFSVDRDGAVVYVRDRLDGDSYSLTVVAEDQPASSAQQKTSQPVKVIVTVIHDNIHPPVLTISSRIMLAEDTAPGTTFAPLIASDQDSGSNGELVFGLEDSYYFTISPLTGVLSLAATLDVDSHPNQVDMMATVTVMDLGNPSKATTGQLHIFVEDVNDEFPLFTTQVSFVDVSMPNPRAPLIQLSTTDADRTLLNQEAVYTLSGGQAASGFVSVDYFTAQVYPTVELVRQSQRQAVLQLEAKNRLLVSYTTLGLQINSTKFQTHDCQPRSRSLSVASDYLPGLLLATLDCTGDALLDSYLTGDCSDLSLVSWLPGSSSLVLASAIPRVDTTRTLVLSVVRNDTGNHSDTLASISISVLPVQSNRVLPLFSPTDTYIFTVSAFTLLNTTVGVVNATYPDGMSGFVKYSVVGGSGLGFFEVHPETGAVYLTEALENSLAGAILNLTVSATDVAPIPLSATCVVFIVIVNATQSSPVFSQAVYAVMVPERGLTPLQCSARGNVFLGAGLTTDDASLSSVKFSTGGIFPPHLKEALSERNNVAFLTSGGDLDTSVASRLWLPVDAANASGSTTAYVSITVEDTINTYQPRCVSRTLYATVFSDTPINTTVLRIIALDSDQGRNGALFFSLASHGAAAFTIAKNTGLVATSSLLLAGTTYNLTARVADDGLPSKSTTCTAVITVLPSVSRSSRLIVSDAELNVAESAVVGTVVGGINVTLTGQTSDVVFCSIVEGDENGVFSLLANQYTLLLARALDYESCRQYKLKLRCWNEGVFHNGEATINVLNVDDQPPQMSSRHFNFTTFTNASAGVVVGSVTASDDDGNATLYYYITNNVTAESGMQSVLMLDLLTGSLSLAFAPTVSREYDLVACVCDQPDCPVGHIDCALVTVHVQYVDQYSPVFTQQTYTGIVQENSPIGSEVLRVHAYDRDVGVGGTVQYSLDVGGIVSGVPFEVDAETGIVTVNDTIDADAMDMFTFHVMATDNGSPARDALCTVNISISNLPDMVPKFRSSRIIFSITESDSLGRRVGEVTARSESTLTYSLAPVNVPFQVQRYGGALIQSDVIDREVQSVYDLNVTATDSFGLSATITVLVMVTDVNDNAPMFSASALNASVSESAAVGDTIIVATATDRDAGSNARLSYSIVRQYPASGYLAINQTTGHIYLNHSLLSFELTHIRAVVAVSDMGSINLSSIATLNITVRGINEHAPVFQRNQYSVTSTLPIVQGSRLVTLIAFDNDTMTSLVYSIVSGDSTGRFLVTSAGELVVQRSFSLMPQYTLSVEVSDGKCVGNTTVVLSFQNNTAADLVFLPAASSVTVAESLAINSTVAQVTATDHLVQAAVLRYTLLTFTNQFVINPITGVVRTVGRLDHEMQPSYELHIQATDTAEVTRVAQTVIFVTVSDVNDNAPMFLPGEYSTVILSNASVGSSVFTFRATDPDPGINGLVSFSIISGNSGRVLSLQPPGSGQLVVSKALNNRQSDEFQLRVQAEDGGVPAKTTQVSLNVSIVVTDLPVFTALEYVVTVAENSTVGSTLVTVLAQSPVPGQRIILYSLESGNQGQFYIEQDRGEILLIAPLDYEVERLHILTVRARDVANNLETDAIVRVLVTNVNDEVPVFSQSLYSVTVLETLAVGSVLFTVSAVDTDAGTLGNVSYAFSKDTPSSLPFSIDSVSGNVTVVRNLDFFDENRYMWQVVARDFGNPPLESSSVAVVSVSNANNHPPVFVSMVFSASVDENAAIGTHLVTADAIDKDGSLNTLMYSVVGAGGGGSNFRIARLSGIVFVARPLVLVQLNESLNISVTDGLFTSYALVDITIRSINQHAPMFNQSLFAFSISENKTGAIGSVSAFDLDRGHFGTLHYSLSKSFFSNLFLVDPTTGVLSVPMRIQFDKASSNVYEVTVVVQDPGQLRDQAKVSIQVNDVNECQPMFDAGSVLSRTIPTLTVVNTVIYTLGVTDCDAGDNALVSFSIVTSPASNFPFTINNATGSIRVVRPILRDDVHVFTVKASDHGIPSLFSVIVINITTVTLLGNIQPAFNQSEYTGSLVERSPNQTVVLQVFAAVLDPANEPVRYTFSGSSAASADGAGFEIGEDTGVIIINQVFHAATIRDEYILQVSATDRKGQTTNVKVTIDVIDIPQCPYYTRFTLVHGWIRENEAPGSEVIIDFTVPANNGAESLRKIADYSLQNSSVPFTVNGTQLFSTVEFDFETKQSYPFNIIVSLPQGTGCDSVGGSSSSLMVTVNIQDVNDSPPRFSQSLYIASVPENSALLTLVNVTNGPVRATDIDIGSPLPRYLIVSENDVNAKLSNPVFRIDPHSGQVSVSGALDFEVQNTYLLNISADDGLFRSITTMQITILDVNDNRPQFSLAEYFASVAEDVAIGTPILELNASDADSALYGPLQFSIQQSSFPGLFSIDEFSGVVSTNGSLDRELGASPLLTIGVQDGESSSSIAFLTITITDVNDNPPVFSLTSYSVLFVEHTSVPVTLTTLLATDADVGNNSLLTFDLLTTFNGTFALPRSSVGLIEVLKDIDREQYSSIILDVQVTDAGNPQLSSSTTVNVTIADINDVRPTFLSRVYETSIPENISAGTSILSVSAVDQDSSLITRLQYAIIAPRLQRVFALDPLTGVLRVAALSGIDFEMTREYNLTVEVSDGGMPISLSSTALVTISITALNEHIPVFQPATYNVGIMENLPAGTSVTQLTAVDRDAGRGGRDTFVFSLTDNSTLPFAVNNITGLITTTGELDREVQYVYMFTVRVQDDFQGSFMTGTASVRVEVLDVNDNAPVFQTPSEGKRSFLVAENEAPGSKAITALFANDTDRNDNDDIIYSVLRPAFGFSVINNSLYATQTFDFEAQSVYIVVVAASDSGNPPLNSSITVTVIIDDRNDNPPIGQMQTIVFNRIEALSGPTAVGCVGVLDADTPKSGLRYSVVSQSVGNYFTVPETSCTILLTSPNTTPPGIYQITVNISDGFDNTLTNITIHTRAISSSGLRRAIFLTIRNVSALQFLNTSFDGGRMVVSTLARQLSMRLVASSEREQMELVSVQLLSAIQLGIVLVPKNMTTLTNLEDVLYRFRVTLQQSTGWILESMEINQCPEYEDCPISWPSQMPCSVTHAFNSTGRPLEVGETFAFFSVDFHVVRNQTCLPTHTSSVGECSSATINSCASSPCLAGGSCSNVGDSYECSCLADFAGSQCQFHLLGSTVPAIDLCDGIDAVCPQESSIQFSGSQPIRLDQLQPRTLGLIFQLSTVASEGRLVFIRNIDLNGVQARRSCSGKASPVDYIHVGLLDGRLVVNYQLGCNKGELTPLLVLNDAQWHSVEVNWSPQVRTLH